MKTLIALVVVLAAASQTFAADGRVEANALAQMGLDSLATMSDAEGETVRGQGSNYYFAYANTASASAVPGAFNLSGSGAINPNVSGAASGTTSSGYYNPYFHPPMTSFAGARGFAFAAR